MRSAWPSLLEEALVEDKRHEGGAKTAHVELEAALGDRIEPGWQHQACQRLDVPFCKGARDFSSPAMMDLDVVICEGDDVVTACTNAGGSGNAQSGAWFVNVTDVGEADTYRPCVGVARIVDDDDFARGAALPGNALKALRQCRAAIARTNHHRDVLRGRGRRSCKLIEATDKILGIERRG